MLTPVPKTVEVFLSLYHSVFQIFMLRYVFGLILRHVRADQ